MPLTEPLVTAKEIDCPEALAKLERVSPPSAAQYGAGSAFTLSSTLPNFARLFQTAAQKIDASATRRTACSAGTAVRPKGPNGAHRSFRNDQ